ncbi:hypothetical protein DICPUDRAFT_85585 [Dictyostelium purpureum]|nr:uncharacterized protein DICPUDRAFT_85585 [Dictyostelium purpureum]EGC28308.1 hypothetical protein DICPUDRAFT_85585 [Dictyostelium purpureum]|eukprot:XP_003295163.1 hypothetical protein DICPUDRAFT_85585 [Dictyostelium purpureum]
MSTGQEDVNICCYSPCGNYISISGTTNCTYVFDTRNCRTPVSELRHKINENQSYNDNIKLVNHAQWSRNGEFFATSADDGCVRLWDVENNKQLVALEHAPFPGTSINYFDISASSDLIVSGCDDGIICFFGLDPNNY